MASQAQKIEAESTRESRDRPMSIGTDAVDESEIAALAYQLWQDRGCPLGSPDEDWFRAEQELKHR